MPERPKRFEIVGPGGFEFGSDDDRARAEQYAAAIRERRGLECKVAESALP